jgi:hypothetical protein
MASQPHPGDGPTRQNALPEARSVPGVKAGGRGSH